MAQLVVIYKTPKDPAVFDAYYAATHIPLAKQLPGLRNYQISKGPVASPAGASGVQLIATFTFDDLGAMQAAFASSEGIATAGDVPKFASGGVDMLMFETHEA